MRIRRYGIYNPTTKRNLSLQFIPEEKQVIENPEKTPETCVEHIKRLTGIDVGLCPSCKKGHMQIKRGIPRIRSPGGHLPSLLLAVCL